MSLWRTHVVAASSLIAVATLGLGAAGQAQAQGCVASRMNAPSAPTDLDGGTNSKGVSYYLPKGGWQVNFGYRNYFSHRHFVGSIEQDGSPDAVEGDRSKNPVENHVNIPELAATYGISNRWSASLDLPLDVLHRRNPPSAATPTRPAVPAVYTSGTGIGDLTAIGQAWLMDPTRHGRGNVALGLGFKLPTGKDDAEGDFLVVNKGALQTITHPVDQSIQPGDGGFGLVTQFQAFQSFGPVTAFASGSYLFNPKETNGVATGRSNPDEAIMSVADQFGARVGAAMPLSFLKGLSVSVDGRLEGVPSSDLFGGSAGFRRPGYSIGIEPGLAYSWKKTSFAFSFPYLVYRNRTQSYADKLATARTGKYTQGDAAFADYIWIAGFTQRF